MLRVGGGGGGILRVSWEPFRGKKVSKNNNIDSLSKDAGCWQDKKKTYFVALAGCLITSNCTVLR